MKLLIPFTHKFRPPMYEVNQIGHFFAENLFPTPTSINTSQSKGTVQGTRDSWNVRTWSYENNFAITINPLNRYSLIDL